MKTDKHKLFLVHNIKYYQNGSYIEEPTFANRIELTSIKSSTYEIHMRLLCPAPGGLDIRYIWGIAHI